VKIGTMKSRATVNAFARLATPACGNVGPAGTVATVGTALSWAGVT
jgi:hypothetical protein